jgi:hypothetical protein
MGRGDRIGVKSNSKPRLRKLATGLALFLAQYLGRLYLPASTEEWLGMVARPEVVFVAIFIVQTAVSVAAALLVGPATADGVVWLFNRARARRRLERALPALWPTNSGLFLQLLEGPQKWQTLQGHDNEHEALEELGAIHALTSHYTVDAHGSTWIDTVYELTDAATPILRKLASSGAPQSPKPK